MCVCQLLKADMKRLVRFTDLTANIHRHEKVSVGSDIKVLFLKVGKVALDGKY